MDIGSVAGSAEAWMLVTFNRTAQDVTLGLVNHGADLVLVKASDRSWENEEYLVA